ncbi:putative ribosome biogenesis protein MAK21 [Rhizoctonia solani 123E]|uniref:Putative ribosome biogenesis protein MAK21 n=1 Tax=Rhizoctonia solani 123E TaxID=1423351 RepID=A0A074T0P3_9AGAM|nr:putative ribosome biogenesis protein MAK21 [Rhizoctonia solani 123E]
MAPTKPTKSIKSKKAGNKSHGSQLKEAVRALGGDDGDIQLLQGIDSDDDRAVSNKGGSKEQNSLKARELAQFVKALNLPAASTLDESPSASKSKGKEKEKTKNVSADKVVRKVNGTGEAKPVAKVKRTDEGAGKDKLGKGKQDKQKGKQSKGDATDKSKEPKPTKPLPTITTTTTPTQTSVPTKDATKPSGKKAKLILTPSPKWYEDLPLLAPSSGTLSESKLSALAARAAALHAAETAAFSESQFGLSSSDAHFLESVLQGGTRSDRLSALSLVVQGAPVHSTRSLEGLRAMGSKKGGRGENLKALRAIVDWWVGGGCPDRKLRYFRDQPVTSPDVTDAHLIVWHFEDWLKKYFFNILQLLEPLSLDPLPYIRTQTMSLIFTLLKEKSEQEQNLLRLLVNKLGDSDKSVASKASFHILQLLVPHPSMKGVIIREMTSLVLKSQADHMHARYYGVITLNQFTLAPGDKDIAAALIGLYFQIFEDILGKGEEAAPTNDTTEERELRRPSARDKARRKEKQIKKGIKGKEPSGGVVFAETEDSNAKLIAALITGVHRALPFAKTDTSIFDKHINTLFRITHSAPFNISIQALVLIEKVSSANKSISDRFYRTLYDSVLDPRLLTSSKQAMYLNLVFKAMKADKSYRRVVAFVKRMLQSLTVQQPPFICGALYLLGELFNTTPGLRDLLKDNEIKRNQLTISEDLEDPTRGDGTYDPKKRDPQWANAHRTCLWELLPFLDHHHPSVSLHARQLLTGAQITATADLGLNTLTHFLDRFVYRNPKKPKARPVSVMHPAAHDPDGTRVRLMKDTVDTTPTVNDESFWKKNVKEIPADQLFFHKFFLQKIEKQKARASKAEKRKKDKTEDDEDVSDEDDDAEVGDKDNKSDGGDASDSDTEDEEGSELDEEAIWKAMQSSMPELQNAGDDSDDVPSGLDDMSDDDDGESEDSDPDQGNDSDVEVNESIEGGSMPDDLDGSDEELEFAEDPDDLIELSGGDASSSDEELVQGKRKKSSKADGKDEKRKKPRRLPTFVSAEDYANMIDEAPEDDI